MICSVEGCERVRDTRGLCVGHYSRFKRHGDNFDKSPNFNNNMSRGRNNHGECDWPLCEVDAEYKNLCRRHYKWMKKHSITLDHILSDLVNGCAACGSKEDLCIDHDHSICSGKNVCPECYRGILCRSCNLIAGYANDDVDRLVGVMSYLLSKHRNVIVTKINV